MYVDKHRVKKIITKNFGLEKLSQKNVRLRTKLYHLQVSPRLNQISELLTSVKNSQRKRRRTGEDNLLAAIEVYEKKNWHNFSRNFFKASFIPMHFLPGF